MLQNSTLKFLKDLKKNNNREWFAENKEVYERAKADFESFLAQLIEKLSAIYPRLKDLTPKDCVFRIYRDVRFSKNKDPYKTNFAASIKPGGRKSADSGLYLHIEPDGEWGNFVGGGYWMPEAPLLKKIRQEIEYNHEEFFKIIKDKNFKKIFGQLEEHKLTRLPKGIPADHPAAEYLKYTSFLVTHNFEKEELKSNQAIKTITSSFKAMQPLLAFLNRVHD